MWTLFYTWDQMVHLRSSQSGKFGNVQKQSRDPCLITVFSLYRSSRVNAELWYFETDLEILSVHDMVMRRSPWRTPSHVCTGPVDLTGSVPSPDSIFVRRWLWNFFTKCLLLCTANNPKGVGIIYSKIHLKLKKQKNSTFVLKDIHNCVSRSISLLKYQIIWLFFSLRRQT